MAILSVFSRGFNSYENVKDGRITSEEFFTVTRKHGYDLEQSKLVFNILDANGINVLFSHLSLLAYQQSEHDY